MQVISYKSAKALGLKRYFTGRPCKRGHVAERFVSNCRCQECAYDQTNEWGKRNTELKYQLHKDWIDQHPGYNAEWVKENPEKMRISKKKWYAKNAEGQIKRVIQWAKDNPEKTRANYQNRRARKKAAPGSHTGEQIKELLKRQKWKCGWCGVSIKKGWHIDHIEPLYRGGSNDISNLLAACPSCNCSKGAKDPLIFAREIGKLL